MCAILDANTVHEVFGVGVPAGEEFLKWVIKGSMRLVAGGKLLEELDSNSKFQKWRRQAVLSGKVRIVDNQEVETMAGQLVTNSSCLSDDEHIVALAQISGARLLYSNDRDLQEDFKNRNLIDDPRGKVYSTLEGKVFADSHKQLLRRADLCRT